MPRVLVVDDDMLVAGMTAELLEEIGYDTVVASSAVQALDLLGRIAPIDAVLTDLVMPGMSGEELLRQLRVSHPTLPVIVATGYDDLLRKSVDGIPRLSKPYDQASLAKGLEELLGHAPAAAGTAA
jgi:CheY-like chemotaxis protein